MAVAQRLAPLLFGGPTDAELAPQTRRLLALLDALVSTEARDARCRREDVRFTRRQAREHTGWSDFALRRHLAGLVELEFVHAHRSFGGVFTYELLWQPDHDETPREGVGVATTTQRSMPRRCPFDRGSIVPFAFTYMLLWHDDAGYDARSDGVAIVSRGRNDQPRSGGR